MYFYFPESSKVIYFWQHSQSCAIGVDSWLCCWVTITNWIVNTWKLYSRIYKSNFEF